MGWLVSVKSKLGVCVVAAVRLLLTSVMSVRKLMCFVLRRKTQDKEKSEFPGARGDEFIHQQALVLNENDEAFGVKIVA